jgi:hypothetical protein
MVKPAKPSVKSFKNDYTSNIKYNKNIENPNYWNDLSL